MCDGLRFPYSPGHQQCRPVQWSNQQCSLLAFRLLPLPQQWTFALSLDNSRQHWKWHLIRRHNRIESPSFD